MNNLINTILIWKLAIARIAIHCFIVSGTSYQGAMGNQHWTDLDGDSRFKLILGIVIANLATIAAFLDKTVANLASGNALPPDVKVLTDTTVTTPAIAATDTAPAVPEKTTTTTVTTPIEPPVKPT